MKRLFVLFAFAGLLLTLNQSVSAQNETVASKLFYAELGGPGVIMSTNWDARFQPNTRTGFGYRIGVGFGIGQFDGNRINYSDDYYTYNEQVTRTYYSIPVGLNYVFGKPHIASSFEVGAGATFLTRKVSLYNYEIEKPGHVIGFVTFMYRLTPVHSGLSLRVGFTPIIGTAGDLFPMGAISLGYAF
jgi:hypothetical protein